MAVINDATVAANIAGVGEVTRMPLQTSRLAVSGMWYRYSGFTGTIGAALAANSEVLQFRFLGGAKTKALVYKVVLEGVGIVAVATAAGPMGFNLIPARSWTVIGSGGTRIVPSANNLKTETGLSTSQVSDIGISTTGALTAGTKTLDANAQGGVLWGQGTGAITSAQLLMKLGKVGLFDADGEGQQPLVLGNQEGFVLTTSHVGVAALTYVARFSIIWAEVTAF